MDQPEEQKPAKDQSRRKFLGAAGIGTGAVVLGAPGVALGQAARRRGDRGSRRPGDGAGNEAQAATTQSRRHDGPDRFGRIFRRDRPFAEPSAELTAALTELGRPGGLLDANDPLEVGPVRLITEPELSPDNRDNPTHTAGTTFMGQFLDHDITRDAGSRLGRPTSVRRSVNLRSARFDLDSVYGGGPTESPELYESSDQTRFRLESGGLFEDLPRDDGSAIVADPRNDENMMISGLQCAFLAFHNAVVDQVTESGPNAFTEAQRIVRWHYQWMILHEFLPQFVGQEMVDDVLNNGRQIYRRRSARIPVEFQTSAYRFGHSMIRPSYRANLAGDGGEPFFGFIFDPEEFGNDDPDDLNGGSRAPRRFIGWQTFFDFGDDEVKPNKRIDTKISTPMFQLPLAAIDAARGEPTGPTSLATRNLLRHITWEIPSGQLVAESIGAERLVAADFADLQPLGANLDRSTPLWLYVLREADVMNDGLHLGPVGGRIVAEVFIGLLQLDPTAYLQVAPDWQPTLPTRNGDDDFRMADMLTIAGVDPDSRGQ